MTQKREREKTRRLKNGCMQSQSFFKNMLLSCLITIEKKDEIEIEWRKSEKFKCENVENLLLWLLLLHGYAASGSDGDDDDDDAKKHVAYKIHTHNIRKHNFTILVLPR